MVVVMRAQSNETLEHEGEKESKKSNGGQKGNEPRREEEREP